jgi:uncharacterized protein
MAILLGGFRCEAALIILDRGTPVPSSPSPQVRRLPAMFRLAHGLLLIPLGMGLMASPAVAVAPVVRDEAHFFSDDARKQADRKLREIYREYGKDLLIETFAEIPADREEAFKKEGKESFFAAWARERARDEVVNGVYVLICKKPGHIQVEVGNHTRQKAFTLSNRDKLLRLMLDRFREKKFDEALTEAVKYFADTLRENLGPPRHEESLDHGHRTPPPRAEK